jgi:hypothetical protein
MNVVNKVLELAGRSEMTTTPALLLKVIAGVHNTKH